jgi:polyisoprenoid-binding protein YceI
MRSRIPSIAVVLGVLLAIAAPAGAETPTFVFDKPHSKVGFQIRHWLTKVEGHFRDFDGNIAIDRSSPANSSVDVTIQAASIDTGQEGRRREVSDDHLQELEGGPEGQGPLRSDGGPLDARRHPDLRRP